MAENIMFCLVRCKRLSRIYLLIPVIYGCGEGGNQSENPTPQPPTPIIEYTIRTEVSAGGTITPQSITLKSGANTSFRVQASADYTLDHINGCGGTLSDSQYNISNISANCVIQANFRNIQTPPRNINAVIESNLAKISWSAIDGIKSYNIYLASKPFNSIAELPKHTIIKQSATPSFSYAMNKTYNNHYVRVSAVFSNAEILSTEQIQINSNFKPIGKMNDTAVSYCLTQQLSVDGCRTEYEQRQDASIGRDADAATGKLTKIGAGSAGFDFTKIKRDGAILTNQSMGWSDNGSEADSTQWSCARDNVTGLIWEIKQPAGINSNTNTFSWFDRDSTINGGDQGSVGNKFCGLSQCNTAAYIDYLNSIQFCGSVDWRLPTRAELNNIVMNTGAAPRLDPMVFPDVRKDTSYWTSSTYHPINQYAWAISMNSGIVFWQPKNTQLSVRLVHSK